MLWVQICLFLPVCLIHDSQLFFKYFLLGEDNRKHGLEVRNRLIQIPDVLSYCKISKIIIPRKKQKMKTYSHNPWLAKINEGNKPHKCLQCDIRFSKKNDLYLHISSVHEGGNSIKCPLCDFRFFRNGYLQRHIASVHEGEKPLKEVRRLSVARSNYGFSEHEVIEPIEEINVQMVVVKKEHGEELNCCSNVTEVNHPKILIHEVQPCQCPICDTIFSSKAALERHLDEMMVQIPSKYLKSG